jgi:hypothetical protein
MLEQAVLGRSGSPTAEIVSIERHAVIGPLIAYSGDIQEALADNGAATQYLAALTHEWPALEAIRVLRDQRQTLTGLHQALRSQCGVIDGLCDAPHEHIPGHGDAA